MIQTKLPAVPAEESRKYLAFHLMFEQDYFVMGRLFPFRRLVLVNREIFRLCVCAMDSEVRRLFDVIWMWRKVMNPERVPIEY